MKKADLLMLGMLTLIFLPFIINHELYQFYLQVNAEHGMIMSFLKFAILATIGEMIALRIRKGVYTETGFGLMARAIVWGILGLTIKLAFVIFANGTPVFMEYLGLKNATQALSGPMGWERILVAFSISVFMNLIYAPLMMTLHRITDTHILANGGKLKSLLTPIPFASILQHMDWHTQWHFVFKKTIPFFWIPAHTITFLLPPDFRVLFAALLGMALGVILATASLKSEKGEKV